MKKLLQNNLDNLRDTCKTAAVQMKGNDDDPVCECKKEDPEDRPAHG